MQKIQQNAVIGKTELYLAWQVQHANAQTLILLGSVILPSILCGTGFATPWATF
jgi:hypothetical protein